MITDEQLDDLPEDDEEAFVAYEAILRQSMSVEQDNTWQAERSYVTYVLAFAEFRPIDLGVPNDPPPSDEQFAEWFQNFVRRIDYFKTGLRLRLAARRKEQVSVLTLTLDFKTQIGGHLTAIRKIVAEAEHLSETKRDALSRRINNLQKEVDSNRTRTEAAMALWIELSSAVSNGAVKLDPALDRLDRIVRIFSLSKDERDAKAITGPQAPKQLPAPPSDEGIALEGSS